MNFITAPLLYKLTSTRNFKVNDVFKYSISYNFELFCGSKYEKPQELQALTCLIYKSIVRDSKL